MRIVQPNPCHPLLEFKEDMEAIAQLHPIAQVAVIVMGGLFLIVALFAASGTTIEWKRSPKKVKKV